ncbi:MAG: sigma-70 family RNA polymerase sigma factor [Cyclobacteriaceae bacterium]|nr:sigma-70 family RNA polymerase sigma factor [Cyclobacteriaceae bacterium]
MNTTEIWNNFQLKLFNFILSRVSNEDDAKDILQTIFEKISKNSNYLKSVENTSAWVYKITKNEIINFYRSKKEYQEISIEIEDPQRVNESEESEFFIDCMKFFIEDMNEKETFILNESVKGKSIKAISKDLDMSYSTIKSKYQRSKEKIRKRFLSCCNIKFIDNELKGSKGNCKNC